MVIWCFLWFAIPAYAADIAVDEECSLADAITAANTDDEVGSCPPGNGADVIMLSADVVLAAELPSITTEMTIKGAGFSISGEGAYRVFYVEASGNLTIERLKLQDGRSGPEAVPDLWQGDGGAIYNEGTLLISDSVFSDNAAAKGGAIFNSGALGVIRSTFYQNSAYIGAGAIVNAAGAELVVRKCTFGFNSSHFAGALGNLGELDLTDSVFEGNRADFGGAIHSIGKSVVHGSLFTFNVAEDGGAIINSGDQTILDSDFIGNAAVQTGGAILNTGSLSIVRALFSRNVAGAGGANILLGTSVSYLPNVAGWGGAIFNRQAGDIQASQIVFESNADASGRAISNGGKLCLLNSEFTAKAIGQLGGAVLSSGGVTSGDCCTTSRDWPAHGPACDIGATEFVPEQ